jgi:hypothetical protein
MVLSPNQALSVKLTLDPSTTSPGQISSAWPLRISIDRSLQWFNLSDRNPPYNLLFILLLFLFPDIDCILLWVLHKFTYSSLDASNTFNISIDIKHTSNANEKFSTLLASSSVLCYKTAIRRSYSMEDI